MKVIVAIDDKNGMMFNRRRQSQDGVLRERIAQLVGSAGLWCNAYTAKQFDKTNIKLYVDENFVTKAGRGAYCFVENMALGPVKSEIEEMLLVRWNRRYPADLTLDVIPEQEGFTCVHTEEFPGKSHEKITIERWVR